MNKKIWLSPPHMEGIEQHYIQEAFDTNWIAPLGPNVDEFEKSLQKYINQNKHVVALNSGTSAIHLALILLGVSKSDEVICQSFTFSAMANSILYQGAIPIFVDSEKNTWNMCPDLLEEAIKNRISLGKKPKAIIVADGYGMPYEVNKIGELGKQYSIPIIEDSANALGSEVNGQQCGTFGDFGILSFNGNKIITTSGGGALITASKEQKEKAIFLATQSRDQEPHYQHSEIGYNYRMSNILAGIGRGQMEVLDARVTARRANFEFYKMALSEFSELQFLEEPNGFYANRWLSCITTTSFEMREKIRLALAAQNIESRPVWKPLHKQPIFESYPSYLNGISENLFEIGLCLPSGSNLTQTDLNRVAYTIKQVLNRNNH